MIASTIKIMGRIKQGLDYFPLSTDFMHDRIVRRVMKREGDSAFTILICIYSYLYSGEGYFVRVDKDFCDELSDQLFTTDNDTVHRVVQLFLEYGMFDSALYERYGILTSADVQRQYLFIARRRSRHHILPEYCLLPEEVKAEAETADESIQTSESTQSTEEESKEKRLYHDEDHVAATADDVAESVDIVAVSRDAATKTAHIKRKEKERKENILPNPPSPEGGNEERRSGGDLSLGRTGEGDAKRPGKKTRELTQDDIDRMQPPADGCQRNFSGLLMNLRLYRVPPAEQYPIVLKSNYGEIDSAIWKGFSVIRCSAGKIKLPGHYLLSVLNKSRDVI